MVRDLDIKNAGSVEKSMLPGGIWLVEHTGLEPVTSTLPVWRAPSCANAPALVDNTINPDENQVLFFQLFILFENREIRK